MPRRRRRRSSQEGRGLRCLLARMRQSIAGRSDHTGCCWCELLRRRHVAQKVAIEGGSRRSAHLISPPPAPPLSPAPQCERTVWVHERAGLREQLKRAETSVAELSAERSALQARLLHCEEAVLTQPGVSFVGFLFEGFTRADCWDVIHAVKNVCIACVVKVVTRAPAPLLGS